MRYVLTFTEGRRDVVLGEADTVETVSAECRAAVVAFLTGVAGGWDKLDLAFWLTGPYARATRHAPHRERVAAVASAPDVTERAVRDLVEDVRDELVAELASREERDASGFVEPAAFAGWVQEAVDADGSVVWVPVDLPRLRLVDRLRGLLAADALNAPDAHGDLYVCGRCSVLAFDVGGRSTGLCPAHRRASGYPFGYDDDAATG